MAGKTGQNGQIARIGRPSTFSENIADELLDRISLGESLASISRLKGMPAPSSVYKWLSEKPSFSERYARARTAQADAKFEQITEISERVLRGELDPNSARVAIDAYKWQAGKLRPQVYGEKIEHVVKSGNAADLTDDELARIIAASPLLVEHQD